MNPITVLAWGGVALGVLGLIIVAATTVRLWRNGRSRRNSIYLVVGLILLGVTGALSWYYWPLLFQQLAPDVDNEELKAQLRGDSLAPTERSNSAAEEWPQWRGSLRDGISPATGLATNWPEGGPKVLWRKPINGGYSSISIAGGLLYTQDCDGDHERVICLDSDGKERWVHRYEVRYGKLDYSAGPRATPTVHDGRVYTVGATGMFLCLQANPSGGKPKVLWQHDLLEDFQAKQQRWGFASSPLVEKDLVIVQPGGKKGSIAAFNRVSGELAWTALDDAAGYSSPVAVTAGGPRPSELHVLAAQTVTSLGTPNLPSAMTHLVSVKQLQEASALSPAVRQIIALTASRLVGLRPRDGKLLWEFSWVTQHDANVATPIVARDYVFISSDYSAGCALVHLKSEGREEVRAEPVIVRRNKVMRNHFSTCVQQGDYLYGFDSPGYGGRGLLKCINLRTIEPQWDTTDLEKGSLIYADGHLLVLTQKGMLALVEATPECYREKAQVRIFRSGGECWALPALAGGRLYLRDGEEIICLNMKN
jgi:outer membrane protein assembly factor BamB